MDVLSRGGVNTVPLYEAAYTYNGKRGRCERR